MASAEDDARIQDLLCQPPREQPPPLAVRERFLELLLASNQPENARIVQILRPVPPDSLLRGPPTK